MFDAKVDVKQLAGLVHERNKLFLACKRALGALNTAAYMDTQIDDMLRDDIAELEKIVAVSEGRV